jgi:hypothetical protein
LSPSLNNTISNITLPKFLDIPSSLAPSVIPADSSTPTFAIASKAGTLNFDSILSG